MPFAYGWGTGGIQLTASVIGKTDVLKVIDQGSDDTTNAVNIRRFFARTTGVHTTEKTIEATVHMRTFIPLRWHRKKNGTVFPVEISGSYFEFKGRSVFVSAIRDITNRKLIKEALEKSEEKFSKAFHSNPAAIVITDLTDQCYIEVNHTFEHLVGYRRDEIVGHTSD
jgi:alpha-D-ribose 1-methylphosphonate 5-phosphate C-P lyase